VAVYVISCEGSRLVKIGRADDPARRCREIGRMSALPVKVLWQSGPEDSYATEKRLHQLFDQYRSHGEWFDFGEGVDPVALVSQAVRAPEESSRKVNGMFWVYGNMSHHRWAGT
jgi:T5orf172 domain